MTELSRLLSEARPFVLPRMPAEPVAVRRAAQQITARWGNPEVEEKVTDPESIVEDMDRRRRHGDWHDVYWADVTKALIALLDRGCDLWREKRYAALLRFLLDQVGPGANRSYIRTMFRKYLDTFDAESKLTGELARLLKENWTETHLPIDMLVRRYQVFDLDTRPPQTLAEFMDREDQPFRALREAGVEAPHGPGLMEVAHRLFVSRLTPRIRRGDMKATAKLLDWLHPPDGMSRLEGSAAGEAIDALLLPWIRNAPRPSSLKERIQRRLIDAYGDPRIQRAGVWMAVSDDARSVILRWLAGATLELFFDIVTEADNSHMWPDRKSLWIELYENGDIDQAWVALSAAGASIAQRMVRERRTTNLEYARNKSRNSQDRQKCLLIMNINGCWVMEGSHNFTTHVFPREDRQSIVPYENSYTCEHLRSLPSPRRFRHWPRKSWRNEVLGVLLQ